MKNVIYLILLSFVIFACTKDEVEEIEDFSGDSGTFVDSRDNHVYKWVRIGDQIWMAENLAYLPVVYPPASGSNTETRYYVYEYTGSDTLAAKKNANYTTYGVLYNWPAAKTVSPSGWHLPTDEEWKKLEMSLGMTQAQTNETEYRGTDQGTQMKATSGWNSNGNGNNTSSFSALPGGYRHSGGYFMHLRNIGGWWSSTDYSASTAWNRYLYYSASNVCREYFSVGHGFSVRCVKD